MYNNERTVKCVGYSESDYVADELCQFSDPDALTFAAIAAQRAIANAPEIPSYDDVVQALGSVNAKKIRFMGRYEEYRHTLDAERLDEIDAAKSCVLRNGIALPPPHHIYLAEHNKRLVNGRPVAKLYIDENMVYKPTSTIFMSERLHERPLVVTQTTIHSPDLGLVPFHELRLGFDDPRRYNPPEALMMLIVYPRGTL